MSRLVPAAVEVHVQHYVGQALARLTRPDEALEHLRRAQVLLEAHPDPWLAIECADWEASALYLKEDTRALSVAERALRLCRATTPRLPGTEARILEHIATIHVKNHTYDRAIAYYEEALQTAGAVRDLPRLGQTYHGLGIAYQERGDLGRAIEFTHKALALNAVEDDKAILARGENELGLLLMNYGQMAHAEEVFRTALAHLEEAGTERAKSHVLLSLGELQLKVGRLEDGIAIVKEAIARGVRGRHSSFPEGGPAGPARRKPRRLRRVARGSRGLARCRRSLEESCEAGPPKEGWLGGGRGRRLAPKKGPISLDTLCQVNEDFARCWARDARGRRVGSDWAQVIA